MASTEPAQKPGSQRRFLSDPRSGLDPFRPLEPECQVVQFSHLLLPDDLRKAGELIRPRPDVQLYVYGLASRDLEFLEHFRGLRRLQLTLYDLEDVGGLAHIADTLEEFTFGPTKKTFSLRFLKSLPQLRRLFLAGHKKDIAAIGSAPHITRLGLSMITLPDLSAILPLSQLSELSILLGGTRDLDLLPRFKKLEVLTLMRITKMADLGVLAELRALKKLHLDWMRNVTAMPSFAPLAALSRVELDTMKGLSDLSPVAAAPMLQELSVTNMPQLTADSFRCLVGHPKLAKLWAYTGRSRVNEQVKDMFPGIAQ